MRAEEKRNQRHTRGRNANPLRSLEPMPQSVHLGQQRLHVEASKRKHNGRGSQSRSDNSHKQKD